MTGGQAEGTGWGKLCVTQVETKKENKKKEKDISETKASSGLEIYLCFYALKTFIYLFER